MPRRESETDIGGKRRSFQTTLWTTVLKAKTAAEPDRHEALQTLVDSYWKPVYYFIRRKGNDPESSKDLAQGFFAALIERDFLQYVQRGRGRFRTFLLTALDHYMTDEYRREQAQKRGGGKALLSLDCAELEARPWLEASSGQSPDQAFLRDWAVRVMAQAMVLLRAEFVESGREAEFESLRHHLTEGTKGAPTYAEIARMLGLEENDIRKRIHRARESYREAIVDIIRSYTDNEEDLREELRDLFSAFS